MNLTTGKWIPVVWADGRYDKVSLLDIFQQGDKIADLAVRPHERISLMRLLICIGQAALDGPADYDEWKACLPKLAPAAANYLNKWKAAFELFGDGPRFLQVVNLREENVANKTGETPSSKLDQTLATGNNTTIFDNEAGSWRSFAPDWLALSLLTYQNFSPCGRIGNVIWGGKAMGSESSHSPCIMKAMVHSYLRSETMLKTIHMNLMSRETIDLLGQNWGHPIWEDLPQGRADMARADNATKTYIGRLVPLSRAIRLNESGDAIVLGAALVYDSEWRETAATIILREIKKEMTPATLGLTINKALWRDAHSLSVLAKTHNNMIGGPLALTNSDVSRECDLWCGGMVADNSKLIDTVESVLKLPPAMFSDQGQGVYRDGVQYAEQWAKKLSRGISNYHKFLKDELDRQEFRKRGDLVKRKAAAHFWTAIEQRVPDLLAVATNPKELYPDGATEPNWSVTRWGRALAHHAREAYDLACPRQTPRQMQAYVEGLKALFEVRPTSSPQEEIYHEQ